MNFDSLEYFTVLARERNFTRAAEALHITQQSLSSHIAALEKELLGAINATGFGPQGFGGATTCLGVAIEQKPTHVACLPVAVNISCHVTRRASRTL